MWFAIGILAPLTVGAVADYRRREIPDWVCVSVALAGILSAMGLLPSAVILAVPFGLRVVGLLPSAFLLFAGSMVGGVGGGDVKLMAALGFALGIQNLLPVVSLATVFGLIWAKVKRQRNVPFGTFTALGFLGTILLFHMFIA